MYPGIEPAAEAVQHVANACCWPRNGKAEQFENETWLVHHSGPPRAKPIAVEPNRTKLTPRTRMETSIRQVETQGPMFGARCRSSNQSSRMQRCALCDSSPSSMIGAPSRAHPRNVQSSEGLSNGNDANSGRCSQGLAAVTILLVVAVVWRNSRESTMHGTAVMTAGGTPLGTTDWKNPIAPYSY